MTIRETETREEIVNHYDKLFDTVLVSVEAIKDGADQAQHYAYTDRRHNPAVDIYIVARRSQPDSPRT